ncbi:MAG: HD domain-containing protein [Proteobacteria bacterium]|nr:HD domain-containing protein [Pseudomonadota bacterium]
MDKKSTTGYIQFTDNDQINLLVNRLVQIGAALSAERNLERLFEMIVDEARNFTNADGGTLYIMSDDETELQFAIIQNSTLNVRMGGTGGKITWHPVKLKNPDGSPNYANVSAYAALSDEVVNIPDVYDAEGFNFGGTRQFDAGTGYRSQSMLVVPMRNHEDDIIGVLQLLNSRDTLTGEVITFSLESQKITESLASQAAIALSNSRLILDLEELLESFIKAIATAIDEKSPYTGGHVRRVAELTMAIAKKINETKEGPYAHICFNEDGLRELRIAAWLHDVGKVTTPEYVVDKATKLETIFDRIEILKARFEIMKKEHEVALLKQGIAYQETQGSENLPSSNNDYVKTLEEDLRFLVNANDGSEFMPKEMIEKVKNIAQEQIVMNGKKQPLLTDNEVYNLSIQRGTLNDEEREIINNHAVVTRKMLAQLPFPKKLRSVPDFAGAHHERLDGTGYPLGLKGDQLPLQARIIALTDVFEALTAKDRPYKKGKTLSEAMKIMSFMVKDNHIDADLFNLFVKECVYLDYAQRELSPQQIDIVES